MTILQPFHVSIANALRSAEEGELGTLFELIERTEIPREHIPEIIEIIEQDIIDHGYGGSLATHVIEDLRGRMAK